MRLAPLLALSVAAAAFIAASPADAQQRRVYRGDQTERITIIDENGRARTKITVRPRSFLDGGTEVLEVHDGLPVGLSPADNEAGGAPVGTAPQPPPFGGPWISRPKLARRVRRRSSDPLC
jgi:hypothetical protein